MSEAKDQPERGQDDGTLGLQGPTYENRGPRVQGPQTPPEEVTGEEFVDAQNPEEAFAELERVLEKDAEEGVPEMSRLSTSQRTPGTSVGWERRKKRRLLELVKPKTNWQVLKDRTTPIWPIPRSTLEYQASDRLRELATPKVRSNIWSIHMSEVSQVSRAARMATPSLRIIQLAKPRAPAALREEWDPMPKPKPHVSDYNRLLHLAMPKPQSDKCVSDRDARWEVLEATKKAVASPRIVSLAKPKVRRDLNEDYDPYRISPASLVARASPRLQELATPKSITKKA
ncbi:sperm microtubule associated protein 2 isoform X2 [Tursiops truncatus]|uniref:sperm microtubule associated protein 2 isoform X2 n=1 Tax=Tursiops truncatus TaxID=9739 RepID=UPI003CCF087E